MILIADSGSTKTNWCLIEKGELIQRVQTSGMNPFFQTEEEMSVLISSNILPPLAFQKNQIKSIYFYGAGCVSDKSTMVANAISKHFPLSYVEVGSDLLGAAQSLCRKEPGIACILGTGSNSCFYNGQTVVQNVPPLGYVLGDEGGGADLGRLLISDLLKGLLPSELKEIFLEKYPYTTTQILERVYKQPFPNSFLADFSPFIVNHLHIPEIHSLVLSSFKSFFLRNLIQYDYRNYSANFIGSIAYYYKDVLKVAATETGFQIGQIVQNPMDGLIAFHS